MNNNSKANLLAAVDSFNTNAAKPFAQAAAFESAVNAFFADHSDEEILAFRHPELGQIFDEADVAEVRADMAA